MFKDKCTSGGKLTVKENKGEKSVGLKRVKRRRQDEGWVERSNEELQSSLARQGHEREREKGQLIWSLIG